MRDEFTTPTKIPKRIREEWNEGISMVEQKEEEEEERPKKQQKEAHRTHVYGILAYNSKSLAITMNTFKLAIEMKTNKNCYFFSTSSSLLLLLRLPILLLFISCVLTLSWFWRATRHTIGHLCVFSPLIYRKIDTNGIVLSVCFLTASNIACAKFPAKTIWYATRYSSVTSYTLHISLPSEKKKYK